MFGDYKRYGGEKISWSSEGREEWTPEQRRAWQAKMDRQREERDRDERERQAAAAARANLIWDAAEESTDAHPYLKRKGCKAHGIRVGVWEIISEETGELLPVSKAALLIPLRDTRKVIVSLQAIFPTDKNRLHRDKDFLKDGAKRGFFFTIGKPVDNVMLICEGYATGASLHEATGHAVVVAFDTSNLEPVASALRARFADARIVLCADNDRWTLTPIENPGVYHARNAAAVIGGLVAVPQFNPESLESKPTDFNDLADLEGHGALRIAIADVLARHAEPEDEEPPPGEEPEPAASTEVATVAQGDVILKGEEEPEHPPPRGDEPPEHLGPDNNPFFEILGFDRGRYFFFHKERRQIMEYGRGDFSESTFIELADPGLFWEQEFRGGSKAEGFNKRAATNFLMRLAERRGIYDADRIRGRGAWFDADRMVYHHGGHLTVDGVKTDIGEFKSRHIYEMQRELPPIPDVPLTDEDGERILEVAGAFRWTKPASAALLCGWIALAPICGALKWRPHIWLTGGAGTGKSTMLEYFVHPLLNNFDIFAQGNTTEAGLRQKLRTDALPVLFEESEQNEDRDRMRMQHVLSLIRQSSTETHARTYKGTVGGHSMEFVIRSMFCLASIQVGIKQQADAERVTILSVRPKKEKGRNGSDDWDSLKEKIYSTVTRDPTIGGRLVRRSMNLLPVIQQNIDTFARQGGKFFGSAREGDQYGTLLAGNWSLFNTELATPDDAMRMIKSYTWEEHRDVSDTDESDQALSVLMGCRLRAPKGFEFTVFELAGAANGTPATGTDIDKSDAAAILKRYGMVIKDGSLLLSNSSHELKNIMANTSFAADWRGVLLRVPGTDRNDNKPAKFNGVLSKCIRIPLETIMRDAENVQRSWLEAEHPVEGQ